MFKKLVSTVALIFMVLTPTMSQAVDLGAMFNSLSGSGSMSSSDAAGVYKSASRTVVSAGGFDMRTPPRNNVTLFSITPPSLSYGCNGISAHFGGFSFISGAQIEQFIQNIVQGAPGLVLELAIKALCPQCEAVLQVMEHLAQQASKFAKDSCAVGQQMEKWAESKMVTPGSDGPTTVCGVNVVKNNQGPDILSAMDSTCNNVKNSLGTLMTNLTADAAANGSTNPADDAKAALARKGLKGNETWQALRKFYDRNNPDDRRTMLILMNLMGTVLHTDGDQPAVVTNLPAPATPATGTASSTYGTSSSLPAGKQDPHFTAVKHVGVHFIYDLLMCGTPQPGFDLTNASTIDYKQTSAVRGYCGGFFMYDWANQGLYDCADNYDDCLSLKEVKVKDSSVIQGAGMLYQVNMTLRNGVELVRTNNNGAPVDWTQPQNKQLAALIKAAPYPLYQAINAAAVYPAAADDLVDSLSVMTAELMVYHIIEAMISPQTVDVAAQQFSPSVMDRMYEAMGAIRASNNEQHQLIGQQLALQEGISRRIYQINQTIQKQVMSDDFLGNSRFNSAVMGSKGGSTSQ